MRAITSTESTTDPMPTTAHCTVPPLRPSRINVSAGSRRPAASQTTLDCEMPGCSRRGSGSETSWMVGDQQAAAMTT